MELSTIHFVSATVIILSLFKNIEAQLEFRPTALIHHEEAAYEYFVKSHQHADFERLLQFKKMEKEDRKETCLKYLGDATVSFSNPEDRTQYVKDTFKTLVEETFRAGDNAVIENFTFEASSHGQLNAPAYICIEGADTESWAISPGYHENVYFVFRKLINSENFLLFGLLEQVPAATAHEVTFLQMENMYAIGKKATSDPNPDPKNKKHVRSLCSLNLNERFRLCAAAFLGPRYANNRRPKFAEGFFINQDIPKEKLCIKNNVVTSWLPRNVTKSAEFISCAFNTDGMHGSVFLTNDPYFSNSAFRVNPQWTAPSSNHSLEDGIRFFKLEDRMTNIRALETFDTDK